MQNDIRIKIGTIKTKVDGQAGIYPVALNLNAPPYKDEGLAIVYLGAKGAGKSNAGAVIAEEFFRNDIPFVYFDRGSNCFGLRELEKDKGQKSIVTIGNTDHVQKERRASRSLDLAQTHIGAHKIARAVLQEGYSLAVDCSVQIHHDQEGAMAGADGIHNHPLAHFANLLWAFYHVGQEVRKSCIIIVDEAHYFAPERNNKEFPIQKLSTDSLAQLAHDSRKAGIATLILGQRATYINKRVLFDSNLQIFGRHAYPPDFKKIQQFCPGITYKDLAHLKTGQAYLAGPNRSSFIQIDKRVTPSLGDTPAFQPVATKPLDYTDHPLFNDPSDQNPETDVTKLKEVHDKL